MLENIFNYKGGDKMNKEIEKYLPDRLIKAINDKIIDGGLLEEIRLRANRQAFIIYCGHNILLDVVIKDAEMQEIVLSMTKNSLYAYKDSIANGYITLDVGVRVGIIGRAATEDNRVAGVYDINELAIRLPKRLKVNCSEINPYLKDGSVLIFAPPGVGKTTLLRSIIKSISKGTDAKRVCVIDTRNELAYDISQKDMLVSILSAYPRKLGIEIAVRTMNAQIIVCDEIGNDEDASAIIEAQGAGVPLIATCHGRSLQDILSHKGIRELNKANIFNYFIQIERGERLEFKYSVFTKEDADVYI